MFRLLRENFIKDFNLVLKEYEHPMGAKIFHMDCQEENKAFAAIFRSQVSNSHGTPHVLEHIMCCGSEKYPVRDPFMALTKRSLNSYMNAWTGADYIAFPFSTENKQDFNNLLNVYLDLIFKPKLKLQDFRQEGWRLDLQDKEIKGVVYNEMKGHYQVAENVFHQYIIQFALGNSEYTHSYGGDPKDIPNLTIEELRYELDYKQRNFYKSTFDPKQAMFYVFGKVNFDEIQTKITNYIKDEGIQTRLQHHLPTIVQPPDILPLPPQIDEGDGKAFLSLTYIIRQDTLKDPILNLSFGIIQFILFEQFAGVLFKEFDNQQVGTIAKMAGLEQFGEISLFNFALQGVELDRKTVDKVKSIIQTELNKLVNEGLPEDMIEGYLHQLEISIKTPQSNQGVRLLELGMNSIVHQVDLQKQLEVTSQLSQLKQKISEGFLVEVIKKYFLDNQESVIIFAQPDRDYVKNLQDIESKKVEELINGLNPNEKEQINTLNQQLEQEQNKEEDLDCLPTLNVSDIPRIKQGSIIETIEIQNIPTHFVQENVNGMTFLRIKFNLGTVTKGLKQYLQMFCTFITKIGTESLFNDELTKQLNQCANGFDASFDSFQDSQDGDKVNTYIIIQIHCLDHKIDKMFELLQQVITEPVFEDQAVLNSVLKNQASQLESELVENALDYALHQVNSTVSQSSFIIDQSASTKFFLNYAHKYDKSPGSDKYHYLDDFSFQMTSIMNHIFKQHRLEYIVHTGSKDKVKDALNRLTDAIKHKYEGFNNKINDNYIDESQIFQAQEQKLMTLIPSQVNYVVSARKVPGLIHIDSAPLLVLGAILSNNYLHREVREKGGAYGSGCNIQLKRRVLNLWSYRDPNIIKTIDTYNQMTLEGLKQKDLDEAKLTAFQQIDRPTEPQSRGLQSLLFGVNQETENILRGRILDTNVDQVRSVFDKYLSQPQSLGVFGSSEHADIPLLKQQGWKVRQFLDD